MNVLDQALKSLKEAVRQPRNLFLTLGLPIVFMVIFGLAFGGGDGAESYDIALVDLDAGGLSDSYLQGLRDLRNGDGEALVVLVPVADGAAATTAVERRDVDAALVVPANFSEAFGRRAAVVHVTGDPSFQGFGAASAILDSYTRAFAERAAGQTPPVRVDRQTVTSQELTGFDLIAPGLMVFAILNLIPGAASTLAREVELGTIDRLRQSPARAATILGGVTLAQLALAAVSVALMLLTARLLGFHNQGSYLVAYGVAFVAALAVVGIGMIVAAFVKTQQEAATLGTLISVPGSFLSGAFFPLPKVELFDVAGRTVHLYSLLPTTHAVDALRGVLTLGRSMGDVVWELGALVLLALLYFGIGAALYRRMRLAPA